MPKPDSRQLLRELIAIPSVNPAFLPQGDPRAGEQRTADFLAAVAAQGGLDVAFQQALPGRSNLLARLVPPGRIRQTVVLAPHMDTVGEPGLSAASFQPRIKNDRMHGRGACDTKGSMAAMLTALLHLAHSADRPQATQIIFAALVDEEHGQFGSRTLAASGFRADLAVVGEPTELKLVTAHKGDVWLRITTRGKSAHGARPELGRNAVHKMAKIVHLLQTEYARELHRRKHPLLGRPTVNVGSIRGGTQPNIVPDHCEISIDRRTIPGETEHSVRREVRSLLRKHKLAAEFDNEKVAPCFPLETDPDSHLIQRFFKVTGQRRALGVDFFCDAAILARAGIPSVVFGPGAIAQAHTADEWIALRSLEQGTRMLTQFLQDLP